MNKIDEKELKQLDEIDKRTDAEVWARADYYYNQMASFNQAFAPYKQALEKAFGKQLDKDYPTKNDGWEILYIRRKEE